MAIQWAVMGKYLMPVSKKLSAALKSAAGYNALSFIQISRHHRAENVAHSGSEGLSGAVWYD